MTVLSNQHYTGKGKELSTATMSAFCSGMPLQDFPRLSTRLKPFCGPKEK